jgi:plastocyanin
MNRRARRLAASAFVAGLAVGAASCGSDTTTSDAGGGATTSTVPPTTVGTTRGTTATPPGSLPVVPGQVDIVDYELLPPTVTIAAGDTVTWVNHDDVDHYMVTEDETTVHSEPIPPGERYVGTITTPGTYAYYCEIHNAMTGTIVVE